MGGIIRFTSTIAARLQSRVGGGVQKKQVRHTRMSVHTLSPTTALYHAKGLKQKKLKKLVKNA
jgi:hypothetical protein